MRNVLVWFWEQFIPYAVSTVPLYRGADESLDRPGRKQATATEDFDFDISYL